MGQMRVRRTGPWVKISCPFSWVQFSSACGSGCGSGSWPTFWPTPFSAFLQQKSIENRSFRCFLELVGWLEHLTCWLRISCSTDWATLASKVYEPYPKRLIPLQTRLIISQFSYSVNTFFPSILYALYPVYYGWYFCRTSCKNTSCHSLHPVEFCKNYGKVNR